MKGKKIRYSRFQKDVKNKSIIYNVDRIITDIYKDSLFQSDLIVLESCKVKSKHDLNIKFICVKTYLIENILILANTEYTLKRGIYYINSKLNYSEKLQIKNFYDVKRFGDDHLRECKAKQLSLF